MHRLVRILILLVLLLVACRTTALQDATGTADSKAVVYRGLALPTPLPLGISRPPPPAWLVADAVAVAATYGSFTIRYGGAGGAADYADAPPAERMPGEIAHIQLSHDSPMQIIIGSSPIPQLQDVLEIVVITRPWQPSFDFSAPLQQRVLNTERTDAEQITIFSLSPLGDTNNQVLQAEITFRNGSQASYIWRINPDR